MPKAKIVYDGTGEIEINISEEAAQYKRYMDLELVDSRVHPFSDLALREFNQIIEDLHLLDKFPVEWEVVLIEEEETIELTGREEKIQRIQEKFSKIDWRIVPDNTLDRFYAFMYRIYLSV